MLLCLDSYLEKSPCLPQLEWLSSHCVLGVTTWEWEEDSPPFMPPPLPPSWFHKTVTTTDCASSLVTLKWVSPTKCYIRTEPSLLLHPSLARGYFVIFHIGTELAHLLWSFNYSHQNSLQFSTPWVSLWRDSLESFPTCYLTKKRWGDYEIIFTRGL